MKKSIVIDFFIANLSMFYVYTDSYEMSPTQRISEVIPWTKQVGVGPQQREFPKKFHGQSKLGLGRRQGTMNSILV